MRVERKKVNKRKEKSRRVITPAQRNSRPSTDEFQVARWVKSNFKMKTSRLIDREVQYFSARKLINSLLDSELAIGNCALFTTRVEAGDFLHMMLVHNFFNRVIKTEIYVDGRRKTRLQLHPEQAFFDGPGDTYVWLYNPMFLGNWIAGFAVFFALFSILIVRNWPNYNKNNCYYHILLTLFVFTLYVLLTLVRLALYYVVRWLSNGDFEFMILPNLIRENFFCKCLWPLYEFKYVGCKRISYKNNYNFSDICNFYNFALLLLTLIFLFFSLYICYLFYLVFSKKFGAVKM